MRLASRMQGRFQPCIRRQPSRRAAACAVFAHLSRRCFFRRIREARGVQGWGRNRSRPPPPLQGRAVPSRRPHGKPPSRACRLPNSPSLLKTWCSPSDIDILRHTLAAQEGDIMGLRIRARRWAAEQARKRHEERQAVERERQAAAEAYHVRQGTGSRFPLTVRSPIQTAHGERQRPVLRQERRDTAGDRPVAARRTASLQGRSCGVCRCEGKVIVGMTPASRSPGSRSWRHRRPRKSP